MNDRHSTRAWLSPSSLLNPGVTLLLALVLFVSGCGRDAGSERQVSEGTPGQAAVEQAPEALPAPSGPVDEELAERGGELFRAKGCVGCHTIGGGRLTGPDLQGVTDRREHGWVIAMIIDPDSMLKNDATARQLFAEYMTPMLSVGVSPDEARALYEYLRYEGAGEHESEEEHEDHDGSE
ncbi:MAG: cytochrome c [Gemmatimonadota bacterium]|nr:MAG: cytochrome c [Gemmatimonadota bacterium]